jgi:hypothetical protein
MHDDLDAAKGVMFGLLLAVPFWALIIWSVL